MRPDHAADCPKCNMQGGLGKKHGAMRVKAHGERKNSECSECIDPPGARWDVLWTGACRADSHAKEKQTRPGEVGTRSMERESECEREAFW